MHYTIVEKTQMVMTVAEAPTVREALRTLRAKYPQFSRLSYRCLREVAIEHAEAIEDQREHLMRTLTLYANKGAQLLPVSTPKGTQKVPGTPEAPSNAPARLPHD